MEQQDTVMLIGEKESFLIRVLLKKLKENGIDAFYTKAQITAIDHDWDRASLVTYYLDNAEHVHSDVLHFLQDKLTESGRRIVLIGEKYDAEEMRGALPSGLILETFIRPLDTDAYIAALKSHMKNRSQGDTKRTILIVDDDPTYIGLIREWLKDKYKVGMASSGMQALQWLAKNVADLILLDFEMPITPGPKVLEMLRADPDTASIPVFFLTSKDDKESVMQVVALRPENYLLKTIERGELLLKLEEFFLKQ